MNDTQKLESQKWDTRFLQLASLVATWSKDPSTKVGSVIVDKNNRVVSLGYNGFPRYVTDKEELLMSREQKLKRTIHSEENSILFAQRSIEGCTIYVTHPPCSHCTAKIIQSGIARVVALRPNVEFALRWAADMQESREMFEEACVEYYTADI